MGGLLEVYAQETPAGAIALVTHGDVIRATLCSLLGIPLDFIHRFEIHLASVSKLLLHEDGVQVQFVNRQASAVW